jgi:DNA-binding transcriptional MerR regulator
MDEPIQKGGCATPCGKSTGACGSRPSVDGAPVTPSFPVSIPLSSGDMARGCETTLRTVRFYEEAGLIEPVARSEGGHRMYQPEQLAKLQLIMDLREAGLSLQDIKSLFELKDRCGTAEEASSQMATALEAQIECMQRKITVLRRLREELAAMVVNIRECRSCNAPEFKVACDECDVMKQPDLSRAMRLLWGKRG